MIGQARCNDLSSVDLC